MQHNEACRGADACPACALTYAVQGIAGGHQSGPSGLELVAMALAPVGGPTVTDGLLAVAEAINDLAAAVREGGAL